VGAIGDLGSCDLTRTIACQFRARSLGATVVIVVAISLLLAAAAQAAEQPKTKHVKSADETEATPPPPEIGSCELAPSVKEGKTTHFLGDYSDSKCNTRTPENGKYRWTPGANKNGFSSSAAKATFEMPRKPKIACAGSSSSGEYTDASGIVTRITFTSCTSGTFKCQSAGQPPGVIVSSMLGGELGYLNAVEGTVGVDLAPINASEPDFADFECPGVRERLTGSVVGRVTTIGKMSSAIQIQFAAKNGVQAQQSLEGHSSDVLTLSAGTGEGTRTEAAGLTMKITENGEEALEIKAAQ
jgi:hypothetical protein